MPTVKVITSVMKIDPLPADGAGGAAGVGGLNKGDTYLWRTTMTIIANAFGPGVGAIPLGNISCTAIATSDNGTIYAAGTAKSKADGTIDITQFVTQAAYNAITKTSITVTDPLGLFKQVNATKAVTETVAGTVHTKKTAWGKVYIVAQ